MLSADVVVLFDETESKIKYSQNCGEESYNLNVLVMQKKIEYMECKFNSRSEEVISNYYK